MLGPLGRKIAHRAVLGLGLLAVAAEPGFAARKHGHKAHHRKVTHSAESAGPMKLPDTRIEPIAWGDLAGWADDDHAAAFTTFLRSCRALVHGGVTPRPARTMHAALAAICRRALSSPVLDREGARTFFEANFRPLRIAKLGQSEGFLTGYYEPIAEGSRIRTEDFTVPLYRRPGDLVAASRRKGHFPNKGAVLRKVGKRKFVPYFDRADIEDGALAGRQLEICWLKDPIDAFFIQIQGSARIRLQDGTMLRVNYDSHNGLPYTPVGRILIERNIISKDEMSMDRIRDWMEANPAEGRDLRRRNKSFVFFRVVHLSEHDEPRGGQGVALTPGRSIAVDKALHAYGTPFFIEAELPIASGQSDTKFGRLMIAQDTGSAIIGPARADIYFGAGDEAAHVAGRIRHPGRFAMLVPREIDPARIGPHVPLPPRRPDTVPVARAAPSHGVEAASAGPAEAVPLPASRPEAAPAHPRGKRQRGATEPRLPRVKPVS